MLVLASASPRRSELLQEWGYVFVKVSISVSEELKDNLRPEETVKELARKKALAGYHAWRHRGGSPYDLIIGADTLVVLEQQILGKPRDEQEAKEMLESLSGRTHQVMTGMALATNTGIEVVAGITTVSFRDLESQEILDYIATGEPMDKAAAYGIQGGAGKFVLNVDGSLTNVIGLPMEKLSDMLRERGIFPNR